MYVQKSGYCGYRGFQAPDRPQNLTIHAHLLILYLGTLLSTVRLWCSLLELLCPFFLYPSQNTFFRVQFLLPRCPVFVYHFKNWRFFVFLGQNPHPRILRKFTREGTAVSSAPLLGI